MGVDRGIRRDGRRRRRLQWAACALVVVGYAATCDTVLDPFRTPPAPGSPTREYLDSLLAAVRSVPERPRPGGYERGCSGGQSCVFGPAWTDANDAAHGRDGCDTRNNALGTSLTSVSYRPGTGECVVASGTLADPYSGQLVEFTRADGAAVHVDHIYPLAAAWDMGAANWTADQRVRFANDVDFNLLVVNRRDNMDKGDKTPSDWLPPHPAYHCFYAGKYLAVAVQYALPITDADRSALAGVAARC